VSKIVVNYNGGASDEYATFKGFNDAFSGQIIKGLDVVPNGSANMTVRVNPGSGRIPTGTAPADYWYMISHDTTGGEPVTITTAASSPRIDYVVAYVDKGVTAVQSPVNNTNNVLKFVAVAGTPAASPVVPTTAQIQAAIGAANPYVILAQVAVAASTQQITTPNITDARTLIFANAGTVKSASIDFASIKDDQSKMPVVQAIVAMGYNTYAYVSRSGNLVTVNMNTTTASMAQGDSLAIGETMPQGLRPRTGGIGAVTAVGVVGVAAQLGWQVSSNGSMLLSNTTPINGATRINGNGSWFTADPWPTT
jgi:hypothetical protein